MAKQKTTTKAINNVPVEELFEVKQRIKRKVKPRTPNQFNQNLPELPQGWGWVVLGELNLDISDGNYAEKYPKASEFTDEGVPFIRATNVGNNYLLDSSDMRFISAELHDDLQRGHLLLNDILVVTRGQIGKVAIVTEPFVDCNINAQLVRINTGTIFLPKFFLYALVSDNSQKQFADLKTGSALQQLPIGQLRQLCVPLAPFPEQERIVSRIDELFSDLDAGVAALERVRAGLKRYKASVLKAACEGKLLENREIENDELPEGWRWAKVEELAKVGTGATPLRSEAKYWNGGKIPWITSGALNELAVHEAKEFITELAVKETNAKVFSAGALLVAMYGEGKTRGKVSELMIDAATNQACAALIFSGEMLEHKPYVKLFFEKNYEDIRLLSSGGVQPNLNLSIIKNTRIPLPPLEEQRRIVAEVERRLSVVGEVESAVEVGLVRAGRLRQSVLRSAFEGRL